MTNEQFELLLQQFKSNLLSRAEYEELMGVIDEGLFDGYVREDILASLRHRKTDSMWTSERENAVWNQINPGKTNDYNEHVSEPVVTIRQSVWYRISAAVAIVILIIGSIEYLWNTGQKNPDNVQKINPVPIQNDVAPGSDKATLTLSDGQKVELNSTAQQTIIDGRLAINNKNGMLTYGKSNVVVYNTMSTPKGGQYRLTLPDGTNVWLNAASSISYPTSFPGKDRIVSITGEAYFEVTKNPKKPFTVKTYKDEITVLGTYFNVNSYADELVMKTSLVEGSVRIENKVLKPGEAYIDGKIAKTNLDQDLAWKNGLFKFNRTDLKVIMRQIERWYDVDVTYENQIEEQLYNGEVPRYVPVSEVLKLLQYTGVNFKIEGKKITVLK